MCAATQEAASTSPTTPQGQARHSAAHCCRFNPAALTRWPVDKAPAAQQCYGWGWLGVSAAVRVLGVCLASVKQPHHCWPVLRDIVAAR